MFNQELLSMLQKRINYDNWVNNEWIEWIYEEPKKDELLLALINHIIKGERIWIQRIMGEKLSKDLWKIEQKTKLLDLQEINYNNLSKIVQSDPKRRIVIKRSNGKQHNPTLEDIILHILSHGDHHRGQLASLAKKYGKDAVCWDYMSYIIEQKI